MITINGRKVIEIHSIQRFYDYSVKPNVLEAVYIEGRFSDGQIFYFKSDRDTSYTLAIDGQIIGEKFTNALNTLHTGEYESDMN